MLFVPGDSKSKLQKARQISADALILDWEDAVLPQNKILARKLSLEFLSGQVSSSPNLLIRINPVTSPYFATDCLALEAALPSAILLSKCQSASEVHQLNEFLARRDSDNRVRIYPQVESPIAILNAFEIAISCPRVAGLAFGAEDFSADMGITRTEGEIELLYARSALVTASRAAGRDAIDSPCLEWKNLETLRVATRAAHNMGFSGKQAIHPAQVPVLNEIFSPSAVDVERARRILAAFSAGSSGVLTVDGSMVDEAVVRRARQILEMAGESFS